MVNTQAKVEKKNENLAEYLFSAGTKLFPAIFEFGGSALYGIYISDFGMHFASAQKITMK